MRFAEVGFAHDSFLLRFELLKKKSKVLTDHLHRVDMHFYLTGPPGCSKTGLWTRFSSCGS